MAIQIQQRRDTAANWTSVNPVLADGEVGIEQDTDGVTRSMKIGNGINTWNELPYIYLATISETYPTSGSPGHIWYLV